MKYCSTRNTGLSLDFREVVCEGLSRDGGLMMPLSFPDVSGELAKWRSLPYADLAVEIISHYTGDCLSRDQLRDLVREGYSGFRHKEITPVVRLGEGLVMELFHGPTYSFKDVALQILGRLFELWPDRRGAGMTILGATSGDTGSAAIESVRGRKGINIFILFPEGRVSPLQELQMTTVADSNVHCLAVEGSFDDCQALVKTLFSDASFKDRMHLSAVNSINWARILAQIVYYFYGYFRWLDLRSRRIGDELLCSVPTGNFGDIFAGFVAKSMGLPLGKLVIASNENDILTRFHDTGSYEPRGVVPTISPSMDIQVSSNFERLLFLICGRDPLKLSGLMEDLRSKGSFSVPAKMLDRFRKDFSAVRVSEAECLESIARSFRDSGYVLDPHSAVGLFAAQKASSGRDFLSLATAHPAKFTQAVEKAISRKMEIPEGLARLSDLPRRKLIVPASAEAVKKAILAGKP